MRTLIAFIAALTTFSAAAASAQTLEASPIPAPKKPNFAPFQFYVGTWSCTTKSGRRATPTLLTQTWSLDETGYWLVGKSEAKATSWNPRETSSTDMLTYDFDAKHWVDVMTDNYGGYDLSTSKGWSAKQLVWHDQSFVPGNGVVSAADFVTTKVSDTKLTYKSSFVTSKGRTVGLTGSCTKQI